MKNIELLINNDNYKGVFINNKHQIDLMDIECDKFKYFEDWMKLPPENKTYQDILMNREYKKVIQYICEKENGILSECYPIINDTHITICYNMKIEFVTKNKND